MLHKLQSKIVILLVLVYFIFLNDFTYCQSTNSNNLFSPENRLRFGNSLYIENDYLRAANEFKEYLKINFNDTVQFKFANCFFKIGRFQEAADNLKSLFFSSSLSEEAKLLYYESIFFHKDIKSFRELFSQKKYYPLKYDFVIERMNSILLLYDDSTLPAPNLLFKSFPDTVQSQLNNFYLRKKFPQNKSAVTAALLSTIVPGAGKIYTGEIGDGITAFFTTLLSAYLAYDNFKSDHQFKGWLFTGLAAFFYGGSIYGSAASAQIYNAALRFNLDKEIKLFFEQRNYFLPEIDY